MQIVKHSKDPMSAMMRSKDGKTMAMKTMTTSTKTRIRALPIVAAFSDASLPWCEEWWFEESRPQRTSAVAMSGRALVVSVFTLWVYPGKSHSLERHFRDWDNGSKHDHANRKGARIAGVLQYIDYDFVTDALSKHQPADHSH